MRALPYLLLALAAPAYADDLPLAVIDRPVVLPSGIAGFATNVDIQKPQAMGSDVTTMALGGGFGITDRLELGANYRFAFDAFELRGPLTVYGAAQIARTEHTQLAAGVDLVADFGAMTTTETLHMGLGWRGDLSSRVAIYTGNILAPNPVGQQLEIGMNSGSAVAFDIPLGVAIQASERVLFRIDTRVARLGIAHARDEIAINDVTPIGLSALVAAARGLDFAVFFNDSDARAWGDRYTLGFVARWYAY
jgi:hypothetical protein